MLCLVDEPFLICINDALSFPLLSDPLYLNTYRTYMARIHLPEHIPSSFPFLLTIHTIPIQLIHDPSMPSINHKYSHRIHLAGHTIPLHKWSKVFFVPSPFHKEVVKQLRRRRRRRRQKAARPLVTTAKSAMNMCKCKCRDMGKSMTRSVISSPQTPAESIPGPIA